MERLLQALFILLPYLHIIAAAAFIAKTIMVLRAKGFDMPAVMISFFRIYSDSDFMMTGSRKRKLYMRINNYINYYIYAWGFLVIITLVIFHRLM